MATGDPAIDLQHKQFFVVLHDFADAIDAGNGVDELKKTLVFLKYYGEWHFGREESINACANCPMACENLDAHGLYMTTIDDILIQIRESGTSDELALSSYDKLTDWLVNHIMKIDMVNANYIKEHGKDKES